MIRFRRWVDHNARALKDVAAKRKARGVPPCAPLSLQRVIVTTHLDGQFADFAGRVGGAVAETYLLRALQWAAEHDGHLGTINVPRSRFGAVVLTRPWHVVGKAVGERVYDSLVASTICVLSADKSADQSEVVSADGSVDLSRPPSPSPSPSPSEPPPPPYEGGEEAAPPPDDERPAEPLRPRVRERFGRVLDYVIQCGALSEREEAAEERRRFRAGGTSDAAIERLLETRYSWVTTDRLARFASTARGRGVDKAAASG